MTLLQFNPCMGLASSFGTAFPRVSIEILAGLTDPEMEIIRAGVTWHHERPDGQGYPDRLAGDDIPLVARIIAVADVFDALRSDRPYRQAMSLEQAVQIIREARGKQFDANLVDLFLAHQVWREVYPEADPPGTLV